jgi:galactose mutarotase-like enzyme
LLTVFIKNKKNVKNLHIYSPKNENFFCVEPVTNTRDSYFFKKNNINYHGLKNLKPGKIFEAAVIFKIIV